MTSPANITCFYHIFYCMAYNIYGSNNLERATFRSKAHPKSETVPGFSKDMFCCLIGAVRRNSLSVKASQSEIESHLLNFAKEKDTGSKIRAKEATVRTHWS